MITLTINGLKVQVEEGTTILEAARFLGFPIPTLCHQEGLSRMAHVGSVLWRLVRNRNQNWFLPAPIRQRKASWSERDPRGL